MLANPTQAPALRALERIDGAPPPDPPELPLHEPLKLMAQIAALCSDLGAHDSALSLFAGLAQMRNDDPNALVALALAQSRAGQSESALSTLRQVLARHSGHAMARVLLAIELHQRGDTSAREHLQAVLSRFASHGEQGAGKGLPPNPLHPDELDPDALRLAEQVRDEILPSLRPELPAARSALTTPKPPSATSSRPSHLRFTRA